ncbi:MAG: hypothetical protein RLZZ511_4144 [Cyanobacteriota bacterium]|jgi:hypothetical protein
MFRKSIALLAWVLAVNVAIIGCVSSTTKGEIDQLSPTEQQLLAADTKSYTQVTDVQAEIAPWCNATKDEMVAELVKRLEAGDIQRLSVAAIGFRRVCAGERITFIVALDTVQSPDNDKLVRHLKDLAYGHSR